MFLLDLLGKLSPWFFWLLEASSVPWLVVLYLQQLIVLSPTSCITCLFYALDPLIRTHMVTLAPPESCRIISHVLFLTLSHRQRPIHSFGDWNVTSLGDKSSVHHAGQTICFTSLRWSLCYVLSLKTVLDSQQMMCFPKDKRTKIVRAFQWLRCLQGIKIELLLQLWQVNKEERGLALGLAVPTPRIIPRPLRWWDISQRAPSPICNWVSM